MTENNVTLDESLGFDPDESLTAESIDNSHINRLLWHLKKIDTELKEKDEDCKSIIEETQRFYEAQKEKLQRRKNYLSNILSHYLEAKNLKSVKVPNGTISLVKMTSYSYPSDEVLLEFSKENNLPINEKVTVKPIKAEIKAYVKETGHAPNGFQIIDRTDFRYKIEKLDD